MPNFDKTARKLNKRREDLIKTEIKANFYQAEYEFTKEVVDILAGYSSNSGILTFENETYSNTGTSVNVKVKRKINKTGAISVKYDVVGSTIGTSGGVLSWGDGDGSERIIEIPIISGVLSEQAAYLSLSLFSPQGGAVLGDIPETEVLVNPVDEITLISPEFSVDEDAGFARVLLRRNTNDPTNRITVQYSTSDGTAERGSDYTKMSGTVTWERNDISIKVILIPITLDKNFLGELYQEYFKIKLSKPRGGAVLGEFKKALINIFNAPRGIIRFKNKVEYINEGVASQIAVQRTENTIGEVSVRYRITLLDQGGADLDDFPEDTPLEGVIVFREDDDVSSENNVRYQEKYIELSPTLTDAIENVERFELSLYSATGGATLSINYDTLTCYISTNYPSIGLTQESIVVKEGSLVSIPVVKKEGVDFTVNEYPMSVDYAFDNGTAIGVEVLPETFSELFPITGNSPSVSGNPSLSGADYVYKTLTESISSGRLVWNSELDVETKYVQVGILDNSFVEFDEYFDINLFNPISADIGRYQTTRINIEKSNIAPGGIVEFLSDTSRCAGETCVSSLIRTSGVKGVNVNVGVIGGTAIEGYDYFIPNKVVNMVEGFDFGGIVIEILEDWAEGKTVMLGLLPGNDYELGQRSYTEVTLSPTGIGPEEPIVTISGGGDPVPTEVTDKILKRALKEKNKNINKYMKIYDDVLIDFISLLMEKWIENHDSYLLDMERDDLYYSPGYNQSIDIVPEITGELSVTKKARWRKERIIAYRDYSPHPLDMLSPVYSSILEDTFNVYLGTVGRSIRTFLENLTRKKRYSHISVNGVMFEAKTRLYRARVNYIFGGYNSSSGADQTTIASLITGNTTYDPVSNIPTTDEDIKKFYTEMDNSYIGVGNFVRYIDGYSPMYNLAPVLVDNGYNYFADTSARLLNPGQNYVREYDPYSLVFDADPIPVDDRIIDPVDFRGNV